MTRKTGREKNFTLMTERLKKELLNAIKHGAKPYLMYALSILNYTGLTQSFNQDKALLRYMESYRYGPYDELGAPDEPEVQDTRAQFAGVLLAYYLWRMPQGASLWQEILKWLPMDLRQRQQVNFWGQGAHLSHFVAHWQKNDLVLQDLYHDTSYTLPAYHLDLVDSLEEGEQATAWLLPLDDAWFPLCLLPVNLSQEQLQRRKQQSVEQWEQFLLEVGADFIQNLIAEFQETEDEETMIDQITKEFMGEIDDLFENLDTFDPEAALAQRHLLPKRDFRPLAKSEQESPEEFATRLLASEERLKNLPHHEALVHFLASAVTAYPQLFLPQLDAGYLLEALALLVTVPKQAPQVTDNGEMRYFWYLFFQENLPEAVAALSVCQVSSSYWLPDQ